MAFYVPPSEKVGDTSPVPPPNCAHDLYEQFSTSENFNFQSKVQYKCL